MKNHVEELKNDIKNRIQSMLAENGDDETFADLWWDLTEGSKYREYDYEDTDFASAIVDTLETVVEENAGSKKDSTHKKTKRLSILARNLKNKKGLDEVHKELLDKGHSRLYLRNYTELILYFCFKNNDDATNNAEKIGPERFLEIKEKCDKVRDEMNNDKMNGFVGQWFQDEVSLYDLKKYLDRNSKTDGEIDNHKVEEYVTQQYTKSIFCEVQEKQERIKAGDTGAIVDAVCELVIANMQYYALNTEKSRYYISKYLYYYILDNVKEFIEIFKLMPDMTEKEFAEYCYDYKTNYDERPWNIKNQLFITTDELNVRKEANKEEILKAFFGALVLDGKPLETDEKYTVSELFCDEKGHVLSLEKARDRLADYIFKDSHDINIHEKVKVQIQELKPENFYCYHVDVRQLAYDIFYLLGISEEVELKENQKTGKTEGEKPRNTYESFKNALYGQNDISREMLLYFLMVINQMLDKDDTRKTFDRERIDEILMNCGFKDLRPGENVFDLLVDLSLKLDNQEFINAFSEFLNAYFQSQGVPLMDFQKNSGKVDKKEEAFQNTISEKKEKSSK